MGEDGRAAVWSGAPGSSAIAHSPAGHTFITGTSVQGNIFIEKYSSDGDVLWSRRVAAASLGALELRGNIALDSAGNPHLAGVFSGGAIFAPGEPNEILLTTTSGNFDFDVFVARFLDGAPVENVPPVADDQNVTTAEDTPLAIALTAADADGDALIYSIVTAPAHGVLSGTAPAVTYTPQPNFHGVDAFTFRAFDGGRFSSPATVTHRRHTGQRCAGGRRPGARRPTEDTPVRGHADRPATWTATAFLSAVATGPSHGTLSGARSKPDLHAGARLRRFRQLHVHRVRRRGHAARRRRWPSPLASAASAAEP